MPQRDFAERVLRGAVPRPEPTAGSLSHRPAGRLLSPEELAAFERGDDAEARPYADSE